MAETASSDRPELAFSGETAAMRGRAVGATNRPRRIVFISCNIGWGGSEDLWSGAAAVLAERGHEVTAYKSGFERGEPLPDRLRALRCRLVALARLPLLSRIFYNLVARIIYPLMFGYQAMALSVGLRLRRRPDLVVLSQGGNHDGWLFAAVCVRSGLPFVIISQKAVDAYWPLDRRRGHMQEAYRRALHAFFVSRHNLRLTGEQFGLRLERASVVRNPFKVRRAPRGDWPGTDLGFRLASIGRLYPLEKGQDVLFRVLAQEKWRSRPVSLTLYGAGEQAQGLREMAALLGLDQVRFGGFVRDVEAIWDSHHALVLASRAEGLPLVLVEAMLSGRVAIVTDVGGNAEVLEDGVTGFLAAAPTDDAFDEAMERAWQRRDEWPAIGARAADRIRELVPPDPAALLADQLLRLADGLPLATESDAPAEEAALAL